MVFALQILLKHLSWRSFHQPNPPDRWVLGRTPKHNPPTPLHTFPTTRRTLYSPGECDTHLRADWRYAALSLLIAGCGKRLQASSYRTVLLRRPPLPPSPSPPLHPRHHTHRRKAYTTPSLHTIRRTNPSVRSLPLPQSPPPPPPPTRDSPGEESFFPSFACIHPVILAVVFPAFPRSKPNNAYTNPQLNVNLSRINPHSSGSSPNHRRVGVGRFQSNLSATNRHSRWQLTHP